MKKYTMSVMAGISLFTGILVTGCFKNKDNSPPPSPNGKFDGEFSVLKKRSAGTGYDTVVRDTIRLTLNPDSGFRVTGDTTRHAGSHGSYIYDYYYISFDDETYSTASSKYHLNNLYAYYYDGAIFQLARGSSGDTLRLQYDLRKAAN